MSNQNLSPIDVANSFAKAGDSTALQNWLDQGHNPNQYDSKGWTPLLWASARGHARTVQVLLQHTTGKSQAAMRQQFSGALPLHMAGHSGNVATVRTLLDFAPEQIDAVWDLNGHTVLLQATFYGHVELVRYLVEHGANTAITTARGLGPYDLAGQFQNATIQAIIAPYDKSKDAKAAYYQSFLKRIAPEVPPDQKHAQDLADQLVRAIETGIRETLQGDATSPERTLATVKQLVEGQGADVNRLGGPLQQPALIVTVTGNNGLPTVPAVANLRNSLADYLLEHGANPTLRELHPMQAQTIIRAAVFNHLYILKRCADYITPQQYTDAINEVPLVNALTAMHDTVLRTTMAGPDRIQGYYDQTRWFMQHGARVDIEDYAGVTQRQIAERCTNPEIRSKLLQIIDNP